MEIPKHVRVNYSTESEEVADIVDQVIKEIPIEIDGAVGTEFIITGHKKREGRQNREMRYLAQMNQISGFVEYKNFEAPNSERYEISIGGISDSSICPSITIRDKKLYTVLSIYLSLRTLEDLPKNLMKHNRPYKGALK